MHPLPVSSVHFIHAWLSSHRNFHFYHTMLIPSYPDITFDEHSTSFLCPVCAGTCNCSSCSRSRGEEFVSMRLGGLAASIFKSKVTLVQDVGQPLHRPKSPDSTTQGDANETGTGSSTQPQFWAHVYGFEGERVGSAFIAREHMERPIVAPSSSMLSHPNAPSQPPKKAQKPKRLQKKRDKSRGSRMLVEEPLASRDLEPSADVDLDVSKGKGRGRGGRQYVRNSLVPHELCIPGTASPTPLSTPSRCSTPVICSDGSLTPLSELEADCNWLQTEVGACSK